MQIIRNEKHYCAECDTLVQEDFDSFFCPQCEDRWEKQMMTVRKQKCVPAVELRVPAVHVNQTTDVVTNVESVMNDC